LAEYVNSTEIFKTINETKNQTISPLAFPIISKDKNVKNKLLKAFKNEVEVRGIAGGNITKQPFIKYYKDKFIYGKLPGADEIHNNGIWIGNNQSITQLDYNEVIDIMEKIWILK
jgi:dTDP-4-amino-4,6-dideoxygalactose transaminase